MMHSMEPELGMNSPWFFAKCYDLRKAGKLECDLSAFLIVLLSQQTLPLGKNALRPV